MNRAPRKNPSKQNQPKARKAEAPRKAPLNKKAAAAGAVNLAVTAEIADLVAVSKTSAAARAAGVKVVAEAEANVTVVIAIATAGEAADKADIAVTAADIRAVDKAADIAIAKIARNAKTVRWITCKTRWPSRSLPSPTKSSRRSS